MAKLDRLFCEETSGDGAAAIFPYLAERLNALKEIRAYEQEFQSISSFGKRRFRKHNMARIASIPYHILMHWRKTYGCWPTDDMKAFERWLNGPGAAWKTY